MAALNFPNSPSLNDTHTENGVTFKWNGAAWDRLGDIGAQGSAGANGAQGAVGAQGAQGLTGPVAGSSSQVVYKDGSNNPAGSSSFTFDGTNLTIGGNVSIGGTLTYEDVTNIDSVGIISARAGVKVPDSQRIFVGTDDDLEIYHDGNSRVRHTGAGDLLLQSNSDVYIQRAADGHQMIIAENDGPVKLYYDNSEKFKTTSGGVEVSSGNLTMPSNGRIFVGNGGNATNPMFANVSDTNTGIAFPAADTMMFTTGGSERLRITSAGQMGLGTNDPNAYGGLVKLAVANTSGTCGLSIVSATNGDGNLYYADGTSGDATYRGYIRYNHTTDEFRIGVAGAEKLRITSGGIHKISTAGDTQDGTFYSTLTINNTGSNTYSRVRLDRSGVARFGLTLRNDDKLCISNLYEGGSVTANDNAFVMDAYSKIGINEASPTARLDINHPHTEQGLVVRSRYGNIATAMVKFDGDPDSNGGDGNVLHLHGGSSRTDSEILHIDSTGVGDIFDIRGDGLTRVYKQLQLEHSSNVAKIIFNEYGANDIKAQIEMDQVSGSAGQLIFRTQDGGTLSERLRITNDGQVNIGGNYTQNTYQLQVDGGITGDYFVGRSLSDRTGYKWGASGIYYLTLGGSRSGNGASFTMFELTGMNNSKFVEIQISFAHAGGGSHGSYRRAVYTSNGYLGLNTLENATSNYGGGGGFTISKPSNNIVRVVWNGCSGFADGYQLCCQVKTSNSSTVFQNVDSAFG